MRLKFWEYWLEVGFHGFKWSYIYTPVFIESYLAYGRDVKQKKLENKKNIDLSVQPLPPFAYLINGKLV